jgi:hypothetical protein
MACIHIHRRSETVDTGVAFDDSELLRFYLADPTGKLLSVPLNARCWEQFAFHLKSSYSFSDTDLSEGRSRLERSNPVVLDLGEVNDGFLNLVITEV